MSAACESVRRRLPRFAGEQLPEAERREVRGHLSRCAACRAEAASQDPTLLFAGLPSPAVSSEEVASVVASVRAGVALKQAERRIAARPARYPGEGEATRRWPRAAAAAAVALLTLAVPSGLQPPDSGQPAATAGRAPAAGLAASGAPEGVVEASSGATVYDWTPGAGEPRVVWIVDGSLDI
ncbi:MAG: zf-HC2 domain-containing protein [Thermoanaerobaculia bacterium]